MKKPSDGRKWFRDSATSCTDDNLSGGLLVNCTCNECTQPIDRHRLCVCHHKTDALVTLKKLFASKRRNIGAIPFIKVFCCQYASGSNTLPAAFKSTLAGIPLRSTFCARGIPRIRHSLKYVYLQPV